MKTPVIIPAFNEASVIGQTLRKLPKEGIEPIVSVNGSTDKTAAIAASFGAEVYNFPEQGKLPALQKTFHAMGERALAPLIILDADTYPLFPSKWVDAMTKDFADDQTAQIIGGPTWFRGRPYIESALRAIWREHRAKQTMDDENPQHGAQYGPNMAMKIGSQPTLDAILEMPHLWPYEDIAMGDVVVRHGGRYTQTTELAALTSTRQGESYVSLPERIRLGRAAARVSIQEKYAQRGAPGSVPYSLDEE